MIFAFIHENKAFLPALEGYANFFSRYNIQCEVVTKKKAASFEKQVEWFFMGTDRSKKKEGVCKIHEYISPSVPPFRKVKDMYKTFFNSWPDFRIYKNEYVKNSFDFKDNIPFCYQDIGINPASHNIYNEEKEFDFIYIGDLSEKRKPELFIDRFTQKMTQAHTLLLVGKNYDWLKKKYHAHTNILFRGPVPREEVITYISKSRFGINYIPDIEPFNRLTSTKLLEYAACGIPIISTDYTWVKQFQHQYGGNYFFILPDFSNFTWENIIGFKYSMPELGEWSWEKQLRKSGILQFLQMKFPGLVF